MLSYFSSEVIWRRLSVPSRSVLLSQAYCSSGVLPMKALSCSRKPSSISSSSLFDFSSSSDDEEEEP